MDGGGELLNSISVRRCLSQPKSRSARWTAGKIMIRLLPSKASSLRTARVSGRQILAAPQQFSVNFRIA